MERECEAARRVLEERTEELRRRELAFRLEEERVSREKIELRMNIESLEAFARQEVVHDVLKGRVLLLAQEFRVREASMAADAADVRVAQRMLLIASEEVAHKALEVKEHMRSVITVCGFGLGRR